MQNGKGESYQDSRGGEQRPIQDTNQGTNQGSEVTNLGFEHNAQWNEAHELNAATLPGLEACPLLAGWVKEQFPSPSSLDP